ncbi:LOW QUALITY PROTEIN: PPR_2 domain-containing protein, partial [Cephalotus follicularis]
KDVISWTSIIVGHAVNGEGEDAFITFRQMCAEKVEPNSVTFLGVLSACDHAGLVEEGRNLHDSMHQHIGCVVDMHARTGMLEVAHKFAKNMPIELNSVVWRMLVNACRVHGDTDLGLSLLSGLRREVSGAEDHVILSNILAEAGRWDGVLHSRSMMIARKAQKVAGKSSVS